MAFMVVSFVVRGLPIGAAIAIGQQLRPERWLLVWLVAGFFAALPEASPPRSNLDIVGIWIGRLVAGGSVLLGALVPNAMPEFVWWIARKLVF